MLSALPCQVQNLLDQFRISPDMKFSHAAKVWVASIAGRSEQTTRSYEGYVGSLSLLFGELKLSDIRLDHLSVYQKLRINGEAPFIRYRRPQDRQNGKGTTSCPAKAQKVNQELGTLIRILKLAGCWDERSYDIYQQLPQDYAEIRRALSPEEQRRWLETATTSPRWHLIFWYSLLAFDTCMSTNEIRALRLQDINLPMRSVTVPIKGAKNRYRHRTIVLSSPEAISALQCLLERAASLGVKEPHHYLFPVKSGFRAYDPCRPMTVSGIKKIWDEVRVASKLGWFRQYDTRHTAITRLAEAGVPIPYMMKRAGHVSREMTDHYTHLSESFILSEMQRAGQVYASRAYGFPAPQVPAYWAR